jgi:hypothetical protein
MVLLRDNTARAKQAISIFWIMLGVTIVNMFSLGWQYYLLIDVQANPGSIDMETLQASDTLRSVITAVNFIMLVLSMIFFIMWFRRAYYNLHSLPWHNARHSEGWAAGSWFIPILSLFWPYQIMEDIWRGTQNAIKERFGEPQSAAIVGWWWTLFLINNFFGYITAFATGGAADVDELLTAMKIEFIGEIISIAAIIIAIRVIQRTSNFEKELLEISETPSDSIFSDNYTPPIENMEPKIEN